mgnify:FL=1
MKKRFHSKYFKKSFITHIVIYIIPIIILLIMIVNSLTSFLQREIETNARMQMERVAAKINDNIGLMNKIAADMYNNEDIKLNKRVGTEYSRMTTIKALKKYLFVDAFFDEIAFYYRDRDGIYTTQNYESTEDFFSQAYNFSGVSRKETDSWINKTDVPTMIPVKHVSRYGIAEKDVVLYIVPLLNHETSAVVIFMIDVNWFKNELKTIYEAYNGSIVFKNNDSVITVISSDKYSENEKDNISLAVTGTYGGFSLNASISKKVVFYPLYSVYFIISVYVAALLAAGLLLISYLTRRAYIPIMNLKMMFENEINEKNDDLEMIRTGIEKMHLKNSELQSSLSKKELELKRLIVRDILSFGRTDGNLNAVFEDRTDSGEKIFQRIIFIGNEKKAERSCADAVKNGSGIYFYKLESEYTDAEIFLVRYARSLETMLDDIFNDILKTIRADICSSAEITVGKAVDDVFGIKDSFLSAESAYYEKGEKKVAFSGEERYMKAYPSAQLALFEKMLNEGQFREAETALGELKTLIEKSHMHMFMKKCVMYELYNIFIKASYEYVGREADVIGSMIDNHAFYELKDINKAFEEFFAYISAFDESQLHKDNSDIVNRCCEFINSNFFEYDLSVQSISEALGILPNVLNRRMKKEIRMNVHEYISFVRMENAKYMLRNTNLPIKTIVENIGYIDVSSFGRKFRAHTGMSLSEYRKSDARKSPEI